MNLSQHSAVLPPSAITPLSEQLSAPANDPQQPMQPASGDEPSDPPPPKPAPDTDGFPDRKAPVDP